MKSTQSLLFTLCACAAMPLIFFSCSEPHTISAKIAGLGNDAVYIQYAPVNNADVEPVMDTLTAINGRFTYDITDSVDVMAYLTFGNTNPRTLASGQAYMSESGVMMLYVKPGDRIRIKGDATNPLYVEYEVKGAGFNHDFALLRQADMENIVKVDSLTLAIDAVMADQANPLRDSIARTLWTEMKPWQERRGEVAANCILNFPNTDLAAFLALQQDLPKFGESYPALGETAKNGLFAQQLSEQQARYENYRKIVQARELIVPGAPAPDFMLTNLSGREISLASFKGKFVVLDFWGSWCGWCLKGMPDMKKYYDKYRRKVEFIGINCRDSAENWAKTVKEYNMNWTQLKNFDDDPNLSVTMSYGISGFPTKIIIDKQGMIVEVFEGETPEFYTILDQLFR